MRARDIRPILMAAGLHPDVRTALENLAEEVHQHKKALQEFGVLMDQTMSVLRTIQEATITMGDALPKRTTRVDETER